MTVIFACRRYRLRDIGLIRSGVVSAGHNLHVLILPWAFPFLLVAALLRLFGKPIYVIVSDKQIGDELIGYLFGRDSTRMMWNYADEWSPAGIRWPHHKVCFFSEAGQSVEEFVFAPQPQAESRVEHKSPFRPIVFLGDIRTEFPIPRGADWWRSRFAEMHEAFGYTFYLRTECENQICTELTLPADRRFARLLAKNLLRLWIVQSVHGHFGERLNLVGSNWRSFDMSSQSSLYGEKKRLEYYRSAVVNLDRGSKSGSGAIYPRSSELISFSGGLLQVRCADTDAIFAERRAEFSFDNADQVIERIESRLMEPRGRREERDAWLVERLRDRELLMQDSINRMLRHSDRLC